MNLVDVNLRERPPRQRLLMVWLLIFPIPVVVTALVGFALGGPKAAGYCGLIGVVIAFLSLGFASLFSRSGRNASPRT